MAISDYTLRAELFSVEEGEGSDGETTQTLSSAGFAWIKLRRRLPYGYRAGETEYSVTSDAIEGETPYRADLLDGMAISADGALYRIMSVFDPDGKRKMLRFRINALHASGEV
ncbi:MAG: hypothetical protein ABW189_01790 [Rickettsiales bacterium]